MSFVEQQMFVQVTQSLESRMGVMETRLNELFGTVDQRFREAQEAQNKVAVQMAQATGELERLGGEAGRQSTELGTIKSEVPQRLADLLQESRSFVEQRSSALEAMNLAMQQAITTVQNHSAAMQTEINQLESSPSSGPGPSGEGKMKSLLDTKQFQIRTLDGAPEHKMALDDWREDMEEYLEAFRPSIKLILAKAARWTKDVDETEFGIMCGELGIQTMRLKWEFKNADAELYTFIKRHLQGRARRAFISTQLGGFDGYRKVIAELDPVNNRTKGAMIDKITSMVQRGSSKNTSQLKTNLMDLEIMVKRFRERVSEVPDESLLASVLSNLLDSKTRETFTNDDILSDYKLMKARILRTATEADSNGCSMDVGCVEVNAVAGERTERYSINSPDSKTASTESVSAPGSQSDQSKGDPAINAADGAQRQPRPPNPNIRCFTCNELGHPSFLCPLKDSKGKGKGTVQPFKGWQKGQWQSKGKGSGYKGGKGSWGKGNKGGGKGVYGVSEWDDWEYYNEWEPSALCLEEDCNDVLCGTCEVVEEEEPVIVHGCNDCDDCNQEQVGEGKGQLKYYSHLGMCLDYDSDEESSGLVFSDEEGEDRIFDPVSGYWTCCLDQSCKLCVDDNDDSGPPGWVEPGQQHVVVEEASTLEPEVIAPQSYRDCVVTMQQGWDRAAAQKKKNDEILSGASPLQSWSPEWIKTRERMLEMQRQVEASTISISSSSWEPMPVTEPVTSHDPVCTEDEEDWSVKVSRSKRNKKPNANQRRAMARKPKTVFTGVIDEESDDLILATGEEWERLELTVDSGAAETICPATSANNVPTKPGDKFRQGVRYTCANGKKLNNLGEKQCLMANGENATQRNLTLQVAEVNRALLSVSRAVDNGNRVVFDEGWSYIEDKRTKERTTLERRGGLYVLEAWVKSRPSVPADTSSPFGRQGQKR